MRSTVGFSVEVGVLLPWRIWMAFLVCTVVCFGVLGSAAGSEDLDVKDWLARPGTRLLVVEFYSVDCRPCMAAVPLWRRLHEKYQGRGLRFVVVSADVGACAQPDWTPDEVVCDVNGVVQESLSVDLLPQAFLWSWQGDLLVSHGHVEQVQKAVESYFQRAPRIFVGVPESGSGKPVKDAGFIRERVRAELADAAKFEIVASESEQEELDRLRRSGYSVRHDRKLQCRLGEQVSANSQLRISVQRTSRGEYLGLSLVSVEDACLKASVSAPVVAENVRGAARSAVQKLVRKLIGKVRGPGTVQRECFADKDCPPGHSCDARSHRCVAGQFEGTTGVLFAVEPSDAAITIGGRQVTGKTIGDGRFVVRPPGKHTYMLERAGYNNRSGEVVVSEGLVKTVREIMTRSDLRRDKGEGWLKVSAVPEVHARIEIDGRKQQQTTPFTFRNVPAGEHEVTLRHPLYVPQTRVVEVKPEDLTQLEGKLAPDFGRLEIESVPDGADVFLDGVKAGRTRFVEEKAKSKAYAVRVTQDLYHEAEGVIHVLAGKTTARTFRLKPAFGSISVKAVAGGEELKGAQVFLDYKEVAGETPMIIDRVPSKTHFIELRKKHYRSWSGEVKVEDGQTVPLTAELLADYSVLRVDATPVVGQVYLGNKTVGGTSQPLMVAPGDYELKVVPSDPRYKTVTRSVSLAVEDNTSLRVNFDLRVGHLLVDSEPGGAELSLDGEPVGTAPVKLQSVEVGQRTLTASLKGHTLQSMKVTVRESKTEEVVLKLTRKPSLDVECNPPIAAVKVDRVVFGRGKATVEALEPGRHTVTCEAEGWVTQRSIVDLRAGQRELVRLSLSNRPEIAVDCKPAGSTIFVNGVRYGVSPKTLKLPGPGTYELDCQYSRRKGASGTITVGPGEMEEFSPTLGQMRWYDKREVMEWQVDIWGLLVEHWDLPSLTSADFIDDSGMTGVTIFAADFAWRPGIAELGGGLRVVTLAPGFEYFMVEPPSPTIRAGFRFAEKGIASLFGVIGESTLRYYLSALGGSDGKGDLGHRFVYLDSRLSLRTELAHWLRVHLFISKMFGTVTLEELTGYHTDSDGETVADTTDLASVDVATTAAGAKIELIVPLGEAKKFSGGFKVFAEWRKGVSGDDSTNFTFGIGAELDFD